MLGNIVVYLVEEHRNVKLGRKLQEGKLETIQPLSVPSDQLGSFMELCGQLEQTRSEKQSDSWSVMYQGKITEVFRTKGKRNCNGENDTEHLAFVISCEPSGGC